MCLCIKNDSKCRSLETILKKEIRLTQNGSDPGSFWWHFITDCGHFPSLLLTDVTLLLLCWALHACQGIYNLLHNTQRMAFDIQLHEFSNVHSYSCCAVTYHMYVVWGAWGACTDLHSPRAHRVGVLPSNMSYPVVRGEPRSFLYTDNYEKNWFESHQRRKSNISHFRQVEWTKAEMLIPDADCQPIHTGNCELVAKQCQIITKQNFSCKLIKTNAVYFCCVTWHDFQSNAY